MRLLLITNVYPSPYRPAKGTFNASLAAGLRDAGDDVRVVAPVPWTDALRNPRSASPDAEASYPIWVYPPKLGRAWYHHWMRFAVMPAINRLTAAWRPELVLGYWAHPDGTVALRAARQLGVPGVLLVGGSDVQILTTEPVRREIILETLRQADRILAVGAPLSTRVAQLGVSPDRIGSFQRGVDSARFFPTPPPAARTRLNLPLDRHIVLWVGRMVPVKGLDVLADALPQVKATGTTRLLLVLIGEGEQREALARQLQESDIDVRFVGTVDQRELPDWYRAADLIVLPSRSEGMPNVLLEALACGTPFVASDVGAIADLLEPSSTVVPPGDAGALAVALSDALQAPPMTRRATGTVLNRSEAIAALRRSLAEVLEASRAHTAGAAR